MTDYGHEEFIARLDLRESTTWSLLIVLYVLPVIGMYGGSYPIFFLPIFLCLVYYLASAGQYRVHVEGEEMIRVTGRES